MQRLWKVMIVVGVLGLSGCTTFVIEDGTGRRGQALESEKVCKDRCMARFHECKDRRTGRAGRGKGRRGKGASACAHEKNRCKARC
ncbi:hypothetical protein FRC98_17470 [Lujinxingia vulgaris]|uniref:Lipoprotein n=1 Tax=Lujinxingia vulgaris TaxID=2600176 RepID=A0A5C6XCU9_9DELT|nr:hypothetical protein [Lujinxingia vulgaris]TXD34912.1 hypothetical protein FRC98_17470 [Lujinxingia vulgaris]